MLSRFRQKNPGRSLGGLLFYELCYFIVRFSITLIYRFRVWGSGNLPLTGPVLVVANHQSHFDPIVAGMALPARHLNFVARSTLFNSKLFGALIKGLNSIPLRQGESDTAAIRLTIDALKQQRVVLVFPEGSRTLDGQVHEFKRGAWLLMSRAKCPILPIGIHGCFEAFPRGTSIPTFFNRTIGICVGKPIAPKTLLAMGEAEGLLMLQRLVDDLRRQAGEKLAHAGDAERYRSRRQAWAAYSPPSPTQADATAV
jgi:1-acyl-sn-glycerol-3-phosphate acyltransferase